MAKKSSGNVHSPLGMSDADWAKEVEAARKRFIEQRQLYYKCSDKIVELNAKLVFISTAKACLNSCKSHIVSADSLLGAISDSNVEYDYGNDFHPMVESLTQPSAGNINGFGESEENLNAAKDKIKKDLDKLADEIEKYYTAMVYLNDFYGLDMFIPNKQTTYDALQKGLNA